MLEIWFGPYMPDVLRQKCKEPPKNVKQNLCEGYTMMELQIFRKKHLSAWLFGTYRFIRNGIADASRNYRWIHKYFRHKKDEKIENIQNTLLRVIPTMTFQNSHVRLHVSLIVSGEGRHRTHLLKCVRLLSQTD